MEVGQVAGPIQIPGGFSILYLVDERKVLTADPRDARLSLRQLTIQFAKGTTQEQATARASQYAEATKAIKGRSDEHTSELQSLMRISYAVFGLKKKTSYKNLQQRLTYTI